MGGDGGHREVVLSYWGERVARHDGELVLAVMELVVVYHFDIACGIPAFYVYQFE